MNDNYILVPIIIKALKPLRFILLQYVVLPFTKHGTLTNHSRLKSTYVLYRNDFMN